MHILLIHQSFAGLDEVGGTRHIEMARYLVQRGHRVTVIASTVNYLTGQSRTGSRRLVQSQAAEPGITILRAYTYPAFHRSFVHRFFSFISFMVTSFLAGLRVRRVDLVWGSSPPIFQGVTAWLLARLKGAPFLFEIRDLWPEFPIAVGVLRNKTLIALSRWLERFLYRRADRVIVNSPGFIKHVTARGARQVTLVPNGADPEMFDPALDGAAFRVAHGLEGKFVVLYAGAHGVSNDLEVVVDAANLLRSEPAVQFVFIGDGKEKAKLVERASTLGLNNITFLPSIPKQQIPEALAAADACLAILKPLDMYKTTYPNKVFDYMAAARPVVLAIDGVVREVIEAAGCGLFAQPGDAQAMAAAVRALAADPAAARRMGLDGRSYVIQHFHRSVLTQKLAGVMEEMGRADG